jgi:hypothetical protein
MEPPMSGRVLSRARRAVGWSLLVAVGALLAACSSGPPVQPVASLTGQGGGSGSSSQPGVISVAQSDGDMVHYARCLRAHGINEPDPVHRAGHQGLTVDIPAQIASSAPALAACEHFLAKEFAAKEAGGQAEMARWLPALTHYAECMRSHDIPMLDPGPQGQLNLGNVPGITGDFGRYSQQFRSADSACRHLLPAGVHDDGTGP